MMQSVTSQHKRNPTYAFTLGRPHLARNRSDDDRRSIRRMDTRMALTAKTRDGDIEWLTRVLRGIWQDGRNNVAHPFDIQASDLLRTLEGYTAPPSPNDPAGPNPPPARIRLT